MALITEKYSRAACLFSPEQCYLLPFITCSKVQMPGIIMAEGPAMSV